MIMDWLKPILPLLQTALNVYLSGRLIKKTSDNAKDVALRSSVIAFGSITFLIFLLTAIIMIFVNLGNQLDSNESLHFSGMMVSACLLFVLGALFLGGCVWASKILYARDQARKAALKEAEPAPVNALAVFGEQFLKQLAENLNQKDS